MANLRKEARGRPCTVRIPGVCNWDPETTVLAHIRRGGTGGMALKPPDVCAIIACSSCHDFIGDCYDDDYAPEILDALLRTLSLWVSEGLI